MSTRIDPDGLRLPIKLDSTSNGEFVPIPLDPVHRVAKLRALEQATVNARRLGQDRRSFLVGLSGAATTLLLVGIEGAPEGELARISRALGDSLRASGRFAFVGNGALDLSDAERELVAVVDSAPPSCQSSRSSMAPW